MKSIHVWFLAAVAAVMLVIGPAARAAGTGYLFVSSEKDHAITVLDGQTYEVVKQIRTAARPRHLAFNPDRSRLYAACGDGNAIEIIDVAALELVDRIGPIDDPEAFGFSPDGETMYISLEDAAQLGILNLRAYFEGREEKPELTVAEGTVGGDDDDADDEDEEDEEDEEEGEDDEEREDDDGDTIPGMSTVDVGLEPEGVLVSPDGSLVFVTSEVANMVHVVDTASSEIRANIVAGNRPRRFAIPAGGNNLWVTNELSGSASLIDLGTMKVVDTVRVQTQGVPPRGRDAGRNHHHGRRKDRVRGARTRQPRGGGRRRVAQRGRLHPGGKPGLEYHAQPRRVPPVRGERPERRHFGDRRGSTSRHQVGAGRTGALCRTHRRLRAG